MWHNFIYLLTIQLVISLTVAQLYAEPPRIEDIDLSMRQDPGQISYRLPNNTVPLTYDITLRTRIDLGQFNFTGTVKILIQAIESTNNITIHYKQINIIRTVVETVNLPIQQIPNSNNAYNDVTQLYVINIPGGLQANTNYTLTIDYEGELRNDMRGFYRSSYVIDGVTRWLATTQFESTDARHAFPCYDEPALKALYKVRIIHGATHRALSNMPTTTDNPIVDPADGTHITEFLETPLISSYLLAFIVTDFPYISNSINSPLPQRAFALPNRLQEGELLLRDSELILNAIEEYISTPFSLPKLDHIAIPDFFLGAMENWGLITYLDGRFYWNSTVDVYTKKTAIVTTLAHELGHQFFGNLISPKWWTYIWLNEGFGSLFEHIGTDLVYPDWKIMDYYVVHFLQNVFLSDARTTTRPMTHYVESHDAVSVVFDNIAYAKSGCVIRMFMHALGVPTFRKALKYYFEEMGFSAATEEDLFAAFNKAIQEDNALPDGFDIETIMLTWTRQSGFPVLKVSRNYETGEIALSQHRYFSPPQTTADLAIYTIPYNFYTNRSSTATVITNTKADYWLRTRDGTVAASQLAGVTANDWILFNNQETGYYRVLYDEKNYELIAEALQSAGDRSKIHLVSRAQLFDDAYSFVETNLLNYTYYLNLTKSLQNETDYIPWKSALVGINSLQKLFSGQDKFPRYCAYVSSRVEHLFNTVGVEDNGDDEPPPIKYARSIAIKLACLMSNDVCIRVAKTKLRDLIDNDNEFHQNVRPELYCAAIKSATPQEFWFVWRRLLASNDPVYRSQLFTALGCHLNIDLTRQYLEYSLNSTQRSDDFVELSGADQLRIFNSIFTSIDGYSELALEFLTRNIDEAYERWGSLDSVIIDLAEYATNQKLRVEFLTLLLLVENRQYASANSITSARTAANRNEAWERQHANTIATWLDENFPINDGVHRVVSLFLVLLSIVSTKLL